MGSNPWQDWHCLCDLLAAAVARPRAPPPGHNEYAAATHAVIASINDELRPSGSSALVAAGVRSVSGLMSPVAADSSTRRVDGRGGVLKSRRIDFGVPPFQTRSPLAVM